MCEAGSNQVNTHSPPPSISGNALPLIWRERERRTLQKAAVESTPMQLCTISALVVHALHLLKVFYLYLLLRAGFNHVLPSIFKCCIVFAQMIMLEVLRPPAH